MFHQLSYKTPFFSFFTKLIGSQTKSADSQFYVLILKKINPAEWTLFTDVITRLHSYEHRKSSKVFYILIK